VYQNNKFDKKKKKTPIIVGGTGLYFKALVDGLVRIPKFKPSEKNKILKLHNKLGQKQFYKKLVKLDPVSKKFINSNDVKLIGDKRSVELGLKYEASLEDWKTEYLDLILSIKKKNKKLKL